MIHILWPYHRIPYCTICARPYHSIPYVLYHTVLYIPYNTALYHKYIISYHTTSIPYRSWPWHTILYRPLLAGKHGVPAEHHPYTGDQTPSLRGYN
jgi:hypothetical protein